MGYPDFKILCTCIKCGYDIPNVFSVKYCTKNYAICKSFFIDEIVKEHLHFTCRRCEYEFISECLNKNEEV